MKKIFLAAAMLLACSALQTFTATAQAQVSDDAVLLTINEKPYTVGDFMYIYQKNNQETQIDKKTIDEYLDLYINFKLKVAAAEEAGIDTTAAFKKELQNYYKQAIPRYMVDEEAEQMALSKAYSRSCVDRVVSHIAVKCPDDATAEEEAAALEKINRARVRVTTGLPVVVGKGKRAKTKPGVVEDFNIVAAEMSEDPSVTVNQGHIGVVRPFRFIYSFEQAAYNTPIDSVSEVFRSPFGFHILKVEREMPHEEMSAAHIMLMTPRNNDSISAVAKMRIDSLYEVVKAGADFSQIAAQYSEDRSSAMRGGHLGYFSKGQMVIEFERTAFALEHDGDISEPVKSQYGWHIIKRLDRRGVLPLDSARTALAKNIKRSPDYQQEIENHFVNKLKQEYSFTENTAAFDSLIALANTQGQLDSLFFATALGMHDVLFTISNRPYTQHDFALYLQSNSKSNSRIAERIVKEKYGKYIAAELRQEEENHLTEKHEELRNLVGEYHDGILLFEVSLKEVWDKASADTAGLTAFFNEHKKEYKWDKPRYKGYVLYCKDNDVAKAAKQIIKSANPDSISSYLNKRLNLDSTVYVRYEKGLWKQGDNAAVDKYGLKIKKAEYTPMEELPVVTLIGKKLKAPEEYNDERGLVTSQYQDYLEQQWIAYLRQHFTYKVNEDVLQALKSRE